MLYGNYTFRCRFETSAHLPPYKGSTFRGVFGRALKQVVCAGQTINQRKDHELSNASPARDIKLYRNADMPMQARSITLAFTIPLRIKHIFPREKEFTFNNLMFVLGFSARQEIHVTAARIYYR